MEYYLNKIAIEIAKEIFIQDIRSGNLNVLALDEQIKSCLAIGDEFRALASKYFN